MKRRELMIGGAALALAGVGGAAVAAARARLSEHPELEDFVRYATLAANGHNTQPWRFGIAEDRIAILPDFARRTPVVDPDDHHLFASLGCAVENLAIAAAARNPGELLCDLQ
ncbi:MAG: Tat pathway signal protein, partial [Mesorhizobium sp.]